MAEPTAVSLVSQLEARFPEWLAADTRGGYSGYLVPAEHLVELAQALRDEFGYDYLSSVTG
ncbi:MAG: NADH-quinone oxidoreductase subunit NuoD, partial [Chloroflexi bacterium]|nr:NADH-quinone oxidoreductase subunit NuoD [Chloroflexota bacterium]